MKSDEILHKLIKHFNKEVTLDSSIGFCIEWHSMMLYSLPFGERVCVVECSDVRPKLFQTYLCHPTKSIFVAFPSLFLYTSLKHLLLPALRVCEKHEIVFVDDLAQKKSIVSFRML